MLSLATAETRKAAATQMILLTTDTSVIQTFGFGFDKTFSCELMLRLKRPSTAVQEVLNIIKGGEAATQEEESRRL